MVVGVNSDLLRPDSVGTIPAVSSDPPSLFEQVRGMRFDISQPESISESIGKENMKKNVQSEKKKRVSRPRVMFDPIFETPMKPKTPKPYTPKPKTSKAAKTKTKTRINREKPPITKTYSRRKKLKESSILQDDCETASVATKRLLDFDLDCHLDESVVGSDEKGPVQDMRPSWFYNACRRKRTPSLVAKARLRRLLPAGKLNMNDAGFKCIKALTRSFAIPTTKKRKRRQKYIKQCDENVAFIHQDGPHEININGLDQSTSPVNKKTPKGRKRQKTSESTKENQTSGLDQSPRQEHKKVPKGKKKQKTSESTKEKQTSGLDQSQRQENKKVPKGKKKQKTSEKTMENHIPGTAGNASLEQMIDSIIDKIFNLSLSSNALVPYHCKKSKHKINGPKTLVPYKNKVKVKVDVHVDPETLRVWNLLKDGQDIPDPVKEADEAKQKWWEEQRSDLTMKVAVFMGHMRQILGDLRFSPWKGSVVDSVVGVYLTQNVADILSSNAFMSVVARYPAKLTSENPNVVKELENVSNHEHQHLELMNEGSCKSFEHDTTKPESTVKDSIKAATDAFRETNANTAPHANDHGSQTKTKKKGDNIENTNWDTLRTTYSPPNYGTDRCPSTLDSVDWDAIRKGDVKEFADTIKERGQHNILAQKIKDFLDRIVNDHRSIDLEWLRYVPPEKTKEYLLNIRGLGLKSVECLRLLTLHHHAFPVDTNVLRIAIRLGWVPLQLSDPVLFHLIDKNPDVDKVQAYLWTRLFYLNKEQLYELHYLLITFGKVLCTKKNPRCNACPMREDCKYYASVRASSRPALEGSKQKSNKEAPKENGNPSDIGPLPSLQASVEISEPRNCEPIIEEPPSPSPEREVTSMIESDIEDLFLEEDPNEMLFLDLTSRSLNEIRDNEMSNAMVTLSPHATAKPIPQKIHARLKTQHSVYELPDNHPLLRGLEKRVPDDPTPYLLAIWPQGDESTHDCQLEKSKDNNTASSSCTCNAEESLTVPGTLLIPCRTAMKDKFPLNGTYFQVNEVFADDESSLKPIDVLRSLIWNLRKRILYCGSSIRSLGSENSTEQLMSLSRGAVCVRGFNRQTRFPQRLPEIFHQRVKSKKVTPVNKTLKKKEAKEKSPIKML